MIIDAKNMILGRLGTFVAKKALLGEDIVIINCGEAIITGNKKEIFAKYKARMDRGTHVKGPFYFRVADKFVKRTIRGMLPYKKEKGDKAFKRIMCYCEVPEKYKDKEAVSIETANIKKLPNLKYVNVNDICKQIGGKL